MAAPYPADAAAAAAAAWRPDPPVRWRASASGLCGAPSHAARCGMVPAPAASAGAGPAVLLDAGRASGSWPAGLRPRAPLGSGRACRRRPWAGARRWQCRGAPRTHTRGKELVVARSRGVAWKVRRLRLCGCGCGCGSEGAGMRTAGHRHPEPTHACELWRLRRAHLKVERVCMQGGGGHTHARTHAQPCPFCLILRPLRLGIGDGISQAHPQRQQ